MVDASKGMQQIMLSMQLCSKNVFWIDVTGRVAVCEYGMSILQTFKKEESVLSAQFVGIVCRRREEGVA